MLPLYWLPYAHAVLAIEADRAVLAAFVRALDDGMLPLYWLPYAHAVLAMETGEAYGGA